MKAEKKQLTPRQGTKTKSGTLPVKLMTHETTYTPSGDENRARPCILLVYQRKQLTPRQGTKTPCIHCSCESIPRNNLRPVRGRKPCVELHALWVDKKQLTPRQGTKTSFRNKKIILSYETTYAPSGDENSVLNVSRSNLLETTYAPSGDENCGRRLQ